MYSPTAKVILKIVVKLQYLVIVLLFNDYGIMGKDRVIICFSDIKVWTSLYLLFLCHNIIGTGKCLI